MPTKKKNKLIIGLSSTVLTATILATAPSAYAAETTPIERTNDHAIEEQLQASEDFSTVQDGDILEESTDKPTSQEQASELPPAQEESPTEEESLKAPAEEAFISDAEKEETPAEISDSEPSEVTDTSEELVDETEASTETTEEKAEKVTEETIETETPANELEPASLADESTEASIETSQNPSSEEELDTKTNDEVADKTPEENTEASKKETADATNTEQKDDDKTSADSPQETLAGDEPLNKDSQAGDAPLDGDGVPNTEEDSDLPETSEGAEVPVEEASRKEPKIQTLAAGDAPLTEEGAELPLVEEGAPIAPGESVKDSEDIVKNANAYNLNTQAPDGYKKVNDAISYRLVRANPTYSDPGYFEIAIRVDTTNRAIDDLYYNDSFNTSNGVLDQSSIKFKSEGESLAGKDGTVNFKPSPDSALYKTRSGRDQLNLNYTMTPEDLKTINDKKGETIFAISGRYTTPPPENASQFGTNHSVTGHQIPYPNENNDGDIISVNKSSVNGNDKLNDIPVTEDSPNRGIENGVYDTGITIDNLYAYDSDGNLLEDNSNRITGRVYTKSGKELDDVRVFFDGESVKLKLPEGAIKDENSVFNGDLKDYKDLEVELFIRPRTDEEISTLYKDYIDDPGADAPDIESGSKSITNEIANDAGTDTTTETLPVNTYDRVRYDNFNTLGRFEISLDDQSNYDVTYWKDGKDTTDKINRLTAGKPTTVEEKYNAYKSVLKSDLDAALKDEIAERKLDTNNLTEVGPNSYVNEDGWKVDIDEEAKTFNVTPPLNAVRGDEISLSVEFKFTNGSTKDFPLIFRVNKEAIETPKYEIKKDEPNTNINSTPSYDEDPDTVQPDRIELESKYNEDDHGNLWNVSINKTTGEITATTPNEVIGEYTLRVPVTAYYKDPVKVDENGEPIEYIRRTYAEFKTQATKPYERTYTEKEPISYPVEIQQDPNLENGKQEIVQQGKDGVKEVTYKQQYNIDGTKNGAPSVEDQKTTTPAVTHIIKVGTKTENTKKITETIPYDYRVEYDENLEAEKYEIDPGKDGTKTTTWNIVNSEIVGEPKVEKTDPIQGVIRVGSKDFTGDVSHKDKEEIPYKVITKENPDLAVGTTRVTTPGEVGTKEVTYTVPVRNGAIDSQDGKAITSTENITKNPVDEVVEIGTKSIEETVEIPFNTEYKYDNTLKAGEIIEETAGQNGENKVVTSYDLATKSAKMTEEVVTAPTNRVVRVGGKTNGSQTVTEKVPFTVEIRENPALNKGEYRTVQDGVVGEKEKILTIENSTVTNIAEGRTITEAKNQIIEVGSADFTGEVTHEVTHEVPFTVRIVEDPTMAPGTHKVVTEGQTGSKTTRYTQNIKNGAADGDLKSEEIVTDTTKAPVEEVIHIGTAAVNSENTSTSGDIPVDITYTYDPTKERGTTEKGAFTPGKVETKIVNQYNPETGKIETTTEETVTNARQEIIVGTKDYTGTFTHEERKVTPFETQIVHDPTLKAGETVTDQTGVNGVETRTITQKFTNGDIGEKSYSDWNTVSEVKNEIIRVGSLTEGTKKHEEAIPFDYKVEYDPTIPAGEYKITQEGKDGKRTTEWTIENSKVVGDPTVTEEAPVNAIIKVGNKDFTGLATHAETFTIPYKVEIRENPDLPVGTRNTIQEGVDGSYKITYKQDIKNGDTVGELTRTEADRVEAQNQIIEIGTKPVDAVKEGINKEVKVTVEYRPDPNLPKGQTRTGELTPGKVEHVVTTTFDPSSGKMINSVEERTTDAKQIIYVGAQDLTGPYTYEIEKTVPFKTEYVNDPNLEAGEQRLEKAGEDGIKIITVTGTVVDGEVKNSANSERITKDPVTQIIRVGTKANVANTTVIHEENRTKEYTTEIKYDDTLPVGTRNVIQEGINGESKFTYTTDVVDGQPGETKVSETVITPVQKEIILVGTKEAQNVNEEYTEAIPYETKITYDNSKPLGYKEETAGTAGSRKVTITSEIVNGEIKTTRNEEVITPATDKTVVIGTKPIEKSVEYIDKSIDSVEIEIVNDPTLAKGTVIEGDITPGKTYTVVESVYNKETGKIDSVERTIVIPPKRTITVGTKDYTGTFEHGEVEITPYKTIIQTNPNLKAGEKQVTQKGINGKKERTVTQSFVNGEKGEKSYSDWTVVDKVQDEIITVGTMTEGTNKYEEEIPFKYVVEHDPNLKAGEIIVEKAGKVGKRTVEWTVKNSEVVGNPVTTVIEEAEDAIIKVGNKDYTGTATHTEEFIIPYTIEIRENNTLPLGTRNVIENGENGSYKVTYEQDIVNGETKGDVRKTESDRKAAKNQVIEVGTKPIDPVEKDYSDTVNVTVKYELDYDLEKGKYREGTITPGKVDNVVTTIYDPQTGEMKTVAEKKVTNATQVVYIGAKGLEGPLEYTITKDIPYTTIYENDPNMEAGKTEVKQVGENGTKVIKVTGTVVDGKATYLQNSEEITKEAKAEIIKIGTKSVNVTTNVVKNPVPFETVFEEDDTLPAGKAYVSTPGENGVEETTITTTYTNGTPEVKEETKTTKEPVNQVVKVGTKVDKADVDNKDVIDIIKAPIPFKTEITYDDNLEAGEEIETQKGEDGERTIVVKLPIVEGKAGAFEIISDGITKEATPRKVTIGTKKTNVNTEVKETVVPFETEIVFDDTMNDGSSTVTQEGKVGIDTTTTKTTVVNGQELKPEITTERTQEPTKQIIKVGTRKDGTYSHTEEIPFEVKIEEDSSLKKGQVEVVTEGQKGSRTTTWTIVNSKVDETKTTTSEKEPVNAVIKVGTADHTGKIEHKAEEVVPYKIVIKENPNLAIGKRNTLVEGKDGLKETKYTINLVNGEVSGEIESELTKDYRPVDQVIEIGTKPVDPKVDNYNYEVQPEIDYVYDDTLPKGTVEKGQTTPGEVKTVITTTRDPETGELVTKEEKVVSPARQEIRVGTKDFTGDISYTERVYEDYKTTIIQDDTLAADEQVVETPGVVGIKEREVTRTITNGTASDPSFGEYTTIAEKQDQVIRVGTKTDGTHTVTEELPFTYTINEVDTLKKGEYEVVTAGKNGSRTTEYKIENSKVVEGSANVTEETKPTNAVINVGTGTLEGSHTLTETEVIPFETTIEFDDSLAAGEQRVVTEGQNGSKERQVTLTIEDGKVVNTETGEYEEKQAPVNKVIKVGSLTEGEVVHEEKIPFNYEITYDETLKAGEVKTDVEGKVGTKTTYYIVKNSEVKKTYEDVVNPTNAKIRVGTKDYTGTITHTEEVAIPYKVEVRENPNMLLGTSNTLTEGKAGTKEVTYNIPVINGEQDTTKEVTSSEKVTNEAIDQVIEIGTKPVDPVEKDVSADVGVEVELVNDPELDLGKTRTGELEPGKVENVVTTVYNPATGKMETREDKKVTPAKQIIYVGTKDLEGTQEFVVTQPVPFETEYIEDPNLEAGKTEIKQQGQNGEKTVTYKAEAKNGQVTSHKATEDITKDPVKQIIRVGTKSEETNTEVVKENIPFEIEYEYTDELEAGKIQVKQEGELGEKTTTTTTTIVNGVESTDKTEETTKEPVKRIVRVGTKIDRQTTDVTGSETTTIPYKTTVIYDPNLKAGEQVVDKQGENGERKITVTVPVKDGVAGDPVVKTEDVKLPVDEVIRVGTRDDSSNFVSNTNIITENIPFETRYEEDPNLPVGETRVETPGQFGSKTVTTSTTIVNGEAKVATNEKVTKQPVEQVVKVGTKLAEIPAQNLEDTKTQEIPYTTIIQYNDKMDVGSSFVVQEGENGETTITTKVSVENGVAKDPEITTSTTKEAKPRIIQVGTKPVVEEVTEQTPFETEVIFDDTLPLGEKRVSGGLAGEKVTIITHTYENGQIVTRKEDKVTKESNKQIVIVGTKAEPGETRDVEKTVEVEIPYTTEIIYDNSLPAGTTREEQAGKAGTRTITVKVPVSEGKALEPEVNENKVTTDPTPRILRVGTMSTDTVTTVTETVKPFATKVLYDDTMPKGTSKVTQEGKNGIETRTIVATVINGITQENPAVKVSQTEPVDQIITVGTKCEDKVTTIDTVVEKIDPFDVIIEYDDTMEKGTEKVVTEGKNGIVEETQTVTVTNGVAGDPKVTNTKIIQDKVDKVIKVGTKCPENPTTPENPKGETKDVVSTTIVEIPFDTEIIEDDTIEAGRVIEQQAGQKGERTITSTVTIKDGVSSEPKITNVITKQPIKRIVRVGTKKTSTNPTPERIVTTEKIPYDTIEVKDNTLDEGQRVIVQKGQEGEKSIIRIGDEVIEEITKQPRNEIVRVGTKKKGNSIPWTEIEDNAKKIIPATPIEDTAKPIEKEEDGSKQPPKLEQPEDDNTSPSVPEKTEDNPVRPQPEEPSEDTHEKPSVDTEDEGRTDGNSDNNPNRGEENTGEEYKPSDDGKENQGETDKKGQEVDPEFTNPDKHGDVTDPEFTIEDDSNPAVVVPTRVEKIDSNKITKSSTNPKTGIGSSTKVIATLAGSMAGLLASKKKKEDEE